MRYTGNIGNCHVEFIRAGEYDFTTASGHCFSLCRRGRGWWIIPADEQCRVFLARRLYDAILEAYRLFNGD